MWALTLGTARLSSLANHCSHRNRTAQACNVKRCNRSSKHGTCARLLTCDLHRAQTFAVGFPANMRLLKIHSDSGPQPFTIVIKRSMLLRHSSFARIIRSRKGEECQARSAANQTFRTFTTPIGLQQAIIT